ncbi:hypothetical protein FBU30_001073 [Linnemannia zychae]|nr:hypothetical protein FBU30_001073 [Linnemannia zychae]
MGQTQSFRLIGCTDVVEIPCDQVDGQYVVCWQDIEQVFPEVQYVKNGKQTVNMMKDANRIRIVPQCIEHHPGVILDVILSIALEQTQDSLAVASLTETDGGNGHTASSILADIGSADPSTTRSSNSADLDSSDAMSTTLPRPTTSFEDQFQTLCAAVKLATLSGQPVKNTEAMQDLIAKHLTLPLTCDGDIQQYLAQNVDRLVKDVGDLKLQGEVIEKLSCRMLKMQQQTIDRLAFIQHKTEAILTQQLELAEYPIPRLFIVLPEETTKYDPGSWFRKKFRLHFICECGPHTEAKDSQVRHHLHLAKHEGYLIREPTEFFKKYGPFLLLMLELIKTGISITGYVVPALANLKAVEFSDSVKETVESVTAKIDYSLECLEALSQGDGFNRESQAAMT